MTWIAPVTESLETFDPNLKIHDFRIVQGITHTNILFDCVVPYEKNYALEEIKTYLTNTIIPEREIYYYVIKIDRPYC